jgi:hypothetical protein
MVVRTVGSMGIDGGLCLAVQMMRRAQGDTALVTLKQCRLPNRFLGACLDGSGRTVVPRYGRR